MRRAAFLVALFTAVGAPGDGAAEENLSGVVERLRETRDEARALDTRVGSILGEIERLDREIEMRETASARFATRAEAEARRAAEARERVAALDRELAAIRERILERAGALVRLSQRGLGPMLFRRLGESGDARRQQAALRAVLDRDRDLLAGARSTREAAEQAREEAARAAEELAARRRAEEEERERLRAGKAEKETVLASLRGEAEKSERLIGELESAAGRLKELLERERPAVPVPKMPAPRQPASSGFRSPLDAVEHVVRSRNGIEIPAESGAAVYAVAAGRVVFADWFPGYGKMVIVDHGRHLHSVYGYAGDVAVERGTVVRAGDVVARAGSTGLASSARLYFEMRERGVPQPPGRYIPTLASRAAEPN